MITPRRFRPRGFVLLIVLWSLGLLALVAATLTARGRGDVLIADNLRAASLATAAADGAIADAIFARLGGGAAPADVRVRDEAGRVNPNVASPALLRAVLTQIGVDPARAEALAAAIVDWRTPGQMPLPGGAKRPQYEAARLPYGPPREPIQTTGELGDVLGMTPDILAALAPHLTLWWEDEPAFALADPVVRQALLDTNLVRRAAPTNGPTVLTFTATVARSGAERTRHATVRFGYSPDGKGYRIFDWADGPG